MAAWRIDVRGPGLLESWSRRRVCAGFDSKMVLGNLRAQGYLDHDHGRLDNSVRLPGVGKTRVYAIKARILEQRAQSHSCASPGDNGDKGVQRFDPGIHK
jgi:hypothetical protein